MQDKMLAQASCKEAGERGPGLAEGGVAQPERNLAEKGGKTDDGSSGRFVGLVLRVNAGRTLCQL